MPAPLDQPIRLPDKIRLANRPHVGFDFGTHSTKIMLRERDNADGVVPIVDETCDGFIPFTSPSVVHVDNGRLWFGTRAYQAKAPALLNSLKARLIRGINTHTPEIKDPPEEAIFTALYWAWLLGRIQQGLQSPLNSVNFAAPMDLTGKPELELKYLKIANAAWNLANTPKGCPVIQGVSISSLLIQVKALLGEPVPDSSIRKFAVLSESTAPIMSYLQHPQVKPGLYLLADMGAGTTELSMNRLDPDKQGKSGEPLVNCYSAKTHELGGDNFVATDVMTEPHQSVAYAELLQRLKDGIQSVWGIGYDHVKNNHTTRKEWSRLTVLMSGGGFRRDSLPENLKSYQPHYRVFAGCGIGHEIRWHHPQQVVHFPERRPTPTIDVEQAFLAVAHGLSFVRERWPIELVPGSTPPVPSIHTQSFDPGPRYGEEDN